MNFNISKNLSYLFNKKPFGVSVEVDNFLQKYGKEPVRSILVVRKPFSQAFMRTLEILSPNFEKKNQYKNLFHTYLIINNKYKID